MYGCQVKQGPKAEKVETGAKGPQLISIHIHQLFRILYTSFYIILTKHCKRMLVVVYKLLSRKRGQHAHLAVSVEARSMLLPV